MTKKELICFFCDHADDDTNENIPYGFCPRCEKDYNEWVAPLSFRKQRLFRNLKYWFRNHVYYRCEECHKVKNVLGKEMNDHRECLPF